jgi:Fur family ferric uptake transcriptional regulator
MADTEIHDVVKRRLAEHDVRYTGGRRAVVVAMHQSSGPRSAAELAERLEDVPLSSLYRTLTILDDAGVVERHHDAEGVARFELAEWIAGHHHHVVCQMCGLVEDVDVDAASEIAVAELVGRLAERAGFEAKSHVLEVVGVCARCRS